MPRSVRVGKGYPEQKTWALQWLGRIRQLYHLNRERLRHAPETAEFATADACLREHWSGLTLFVDDPRIPLDNNYGERQIRGPAVGRKNYYGSGALWAGRLAVMIFSIFSTLVLWKINSREWLSWYFEACANNGGKAPADPELFLPWNLSEIRLTELQNTKIDSDSNTS